MCEPKKFWAHPQAVQSRDFDNSTDIKDTAKEGKIKQYLNLSVLFIFSISFVVG